MATAPRMESQHKCVRWVSVREGLGWAEWVAVGVLAGRWKHRIPVTRRESPGRTSVDEMW